MNSKKLKLIIDSSVYDEQLLWSTIEILSNEYFIKIDKKSSNFHLTVSAKYLVKIKKSDFIQRFYDELNNQKVRNRLTKEFGNLREMIVGKALFSTEAFDDSSNINFEDSLQDNYISDDRKIGMTFENKYEKQKTK